MVMETSEIQTKDGNRIPLKHTLNCRNYGIYAAQCVTCGEFYVGQTINAFHQRWTGHRNSWKNQIQKITSNILGRRSGEKPSEKRPGRKTSLTANDENAFLLHFQKRHPGITINPRSKLEDLYKVVFLEQSKKENLDVAEGYWISQLKAGINIAATTIPKFK